MRVKNVQYLQLNELRDHYEAEKQVVEALPRVAKAASSEQLLQAAKQHPDETKAQAERLDDGFEPLDEPADQKPNQIAPSEVNQAALEAVA
jgi:ferritin-like metal-binding protein YciE